MGGHCIMINESSDHDQPHSEARIQFRIGLDADVFDSTTTLKRHIGLWVSERIYVPLHPSSFCIRNWNMYRCLCPLSGSWSESLTSLMSLPFHRDCRLGARRWARRLTYCQLCQPNSWHTTELDQKPPKNHLQNTTIQPPTHSSIHPLSQPVVLDCVPFVAFCMLYFDLHNLNLLHSPGISRCHMPVRKRRLSLCRKRREEEPGARSKASPNKAEQWEVAPLESSGWAHWTLTDFSQCLWLC